MVGARACGGAESRERRKGRGHRRNRRAPLRCRFDWMTLYFSFFRRYFTWFVPCLLIIAYANSDENLNQICSSWSPSYICSQALISQSFMWSLMRSMRYSWYLEVFLSNSRPRTSKILSGQNSHFLRLGGKGILILRSVANR